MCKTYQLPLRCIYSPRLLPYKDLQPRLLNPSRCAAHNKHTGVLGRAVLGVTNQSARSPPDPSFLSLVSVSPSFLHALPTLVKFPRPKQHRLWYPHIHHPCGQQATSGGPNSTQIIRSLAPGRDLCWSSACPSFFTCIIVDLCEPATLKVDVLPGQWPLCSK